MVDVNRVVRAEFENSRQLNGLMQDARLGNAGHLRPTVRVRRAKLAGVPIVLRDFISAVTHAERTKLDQSLCPQEYQDVDRLERKARMNTIGYLSATGVGVLCGFFPVLRILAAILIGTVLRDVIAVVVRDVRNRKIFTSYFLALVRIACLMSVGFFAWAGIAGVISNIVLRIRKQAEKRIDRQLSNVFGELSDSATRITQDGTETIPIECVEVGDELVVSPGEILPVDGLVSAGCSTIDQHQLTGESKPVERERGDQVLAGTLVLSGRLRVKVEKTGEETLVASLGKIINETRAFKNELVLRGQKTADSMVPFRLALSAFTLLAMGSTAAVAVLWAGLGGRMALYGPLSVLNYLQIFSREGILIKDGRIIEQIRDIDTVVFDKTGTLTVPTPQIRQIHCSGSTPQAELLAYAAAAEACQTHPIANAIKEMADDELVARLEIQEESLEVGFGVQAVVNGRRILVGSRKFMSHEKIVISEDIGCRQELVEGRGHSLVYVSIDGRIEGFFEIESRLRPEIPSIVRLLTKRKIEVIVLSGDHEQPTRAIAGKIGVQKYFCDTLPHEKAAVVERLRKEGRKVCFVGDGINDAVALNAADVSVSLTGASKAATDSAQVVLMDGTLNQLMRLFELADEFERDMYFNSVISFGPGIATIAGVYLFQFGIVSSLIIGFGSTFAGLINTLTPLRKYSREPRRNYDPRSRRSRESRVFLHRC